MRVDTYTLNPPVLTRKVNIMCFSDFVFVCLFVSVFELTRVDTCTESHMEDHGCYVYVYTAKGQSPYYDHCMWRTIVLIFCGQSLCGQTSTWPSLLHCSLPPQATKSQLASAPLDVDIKELEGFYMTDAISRASLTMAKCVSAVQADQAKHVHWPSSGLV